MVSSFIVVTRARLPVEKLFHVSLSIDAHGTSISNDQRSGSVRDASHAADRATRARHAPRMIGPQNAAWQA